MLIFGTINILFPDAIDSIWRIEQASSNIRIGFAMVVVFFPTYIILTRMVNKSRRKESNHSYLGLTKWLIYLSLLVGGAVLLGDLVAVIMAFLEGEITTRFILKALAVLLVVGSAFSYYLLDAKGYWLKNESGSIYFAFIASLVVLVSLVTGFRNIPSPAEVREQKLDNQMIMDLQGIQRQVEQYYLLNETLPPDLDELYEPLDYPEAPEGREGYVYEVSGEQTYQLCATFLKDAEVTDRSYAYPVYEQNYNWNHQSGYWCFDRKVNDTKDL